MGVCLHSFVFGPAPVRPRWRSTGRRRTLTHPRRGQDSQGATFLLRAQYLHSSSLVTILSSRPRTRQQLMLPGPCREGTVLPSAYPAKSNCNPDCQISASGSFEGGDTAAQIVHHIIRLYSMAQLSSLISKIRINYVLCNSKCEKLNFPSSFFEFPSDVLKATPQRRGIDECSIKQQTKTNRLPRRHGLQP